MKKYGHTKTLFIKGGKYQWSYKHNHCIECGNCNKPHKGRGLCTSCWDKDREGDKNRKLTKFKANWKYYYKNRILHFLEKTEKSRRGQVAFLTEDDKKKYKKGWYQRNREVLNLYQASRRRLKKGLPCLKIIISGKDRYLPFESIEKPVCTQNNMYLYDEWKEKLRKFDLIKQYYARNNMTNMLK